MRNLNLLDVNLFLAKVYSPNHRMIRYYCLKVSNSKIYKLSKMAVKIGNLSISPL